MPIFEVEISNKITFRTEAMSKGIAESQAIMKLRAILEGSQASRIHVVNSTVDQPIKATEIQP